MNPIAPSTPVANLKTDGSGAVEQMYAELATLGLGSLESFVVTCPDGETAAQGDFLHVVMADGTKIAVWLDIDAAGTAPNGAIFSAVDDSALVPVVLTGTPSTAIEVAAALKTAIEATDLDTVTIVDNLDGTLTFTSDVLGNITNSAVYAEDEVAASSLAIAVTAGSAASSQNDYLVLSDDDTGLFHAWFNVNGEGVDPDPGGGSFGIEVEIAAAATSAQAATALAAAIEAHAEFEAEADGSRVKIIAGSRASVVDMTAGDSGITFSIQVQGYAEQKPSPGTLTSSLTNS
jgi:hypothetical protein